MTTAILDFLSLPAGFSGGACALPHLGIISADGPDAVSFLHNQLTHDFALLKSDQVRLCGYCSPKGRLLASFVGYRRTDEQVLLVCSRDLLAQVLKRLSMFVLRAKVRLSDATDRFTLRGLVGAPVSARMPQDAAMSPWKRLSLDGADLLTLYPALGLPRALWVGEHPPPVDTPELAIEDWLALDVLSGVAQVQAATTEAFVPQMINHESVDGVSFQKGCYPGQEVVARSQFRGAIKRRGQLFVSPTPQPVGAELFLANDPTQPCGMVAQSAPWKGQTVLIASVQLQALESTDTSLQDAQGHRLTLLPLPYQLRHDL